MTFKKLIFTQIFISVILASPSPQIGGLGFGVLGGDNGLVKPGHGRMSGSNREVTTGLLNGDIGAANGLVKLGTAEEIKPREPAFEAPLHHESQQNEEEAEVQAEVQAEPEAVDTRTSHMHSRLSPEDELFLRHPHLSPEEQLLFEEEALLLHRGPDEHFHEEITIEEKPHEPIIIESKPESFGFNSFMPEFAKEFFSDESI